MQANKLKLKLVIGLGNPDKKYTNTYHNVGFLAVDFLTKNPPIFNSQFLISKSDEYMNNSGRFAAKMLKKHNVKSENLLIIQDDSDLKIGQYKFTEPGHSAAGHHGIESIQQYVPNKFWRLRIGIRPPEEKIRQKAEKFVLKKISSAHKKILEEVFEETAQEIKKPYKTAFSG